MSIQINTSGVAITPHIEKKTRISKEAIDRLKVISSEAWRIDAWQTKKARNSAIKERMQVQAKKVQRVDNPKAHSAFQKLFMEAKTAQEKCELVHKWKVKDPELMQRLNG